MASHLLLRPWGTAAGTKLQLRAKPRRRVIGKARSLITAKRKDEETVALVRQAEQKQVVAEEKKESFIEWSGKVTRGIPGQRIEQTLYPWLLVIPLAYIGFSLVNAVIKATVSMRSSRLR